MCAATTVAPGDCVQGAPESDGGAVDGWLVAHVLARVVDHDEIKLCAFFEHANGFRRIYEKRLKFRGGA